MKFPSLVKSQFCKTPVEITIYGEGVTEDGAPISAFECQDLCPSEDLYPSETLHIGNLFCNLQSNAKTVYTKEQKIVQMSGVLLFNGDIAPNCEIISGGFVLLNGEKRIIVKGVKHRNPDGTVNYTELDVI
ncbi:MAG: hypothetical protein U0L20_01585 [Ruminococcus sp.]|nr:hypothetical protein [Ruminococcus sp.]